MNRVGNPGSAIKRTESFSLAIIVHNCEIAAFAGVTTTSSVKNS